MASPSTPLTGRSSPPSTPLTGSWRHPAMDQIIERSKQKGPADTHHQRLMMNLFALIATFAAKWVWEIHVSRMLPPFLGKLVSKMANSLATKDIQWVCGYLVLASRALFTFNVLEATYRLLRPDPDFADLPLTSEQRKLLGLNPNVESTNPKIHTPPRNPRTATSVKNSPHEPSIISSPSTSFTSSYLSPTSPNATITRQHNYSAEPPMTPSPLRTAHRGSVGNSLGFSVHAGTSSPMSGSVFNTPSPINRLAGGSTPFGAGGSSVPVGGRWVYEKLGRRGEGMRFSPSKNSLFAINSPTRGA